MQPYAITRKHTHLVQLRARLDHVAALQRVNGVLGQLLHIAAPESWWWWW